MSRPMCHPPQVKGCAAHFTPQLSSQPSSERCLYISHFTGEGTEAGYAYGTDPRSHSQKGMNHPEFKPRAPHFQTHSKGSFLLPSLFWSCKVIDGPQLEKGMAIHSSILAWRIQWTEEPGGLQSLELQRVGHNWASFYLLTTYTSILSSGSFLNKHTNHWLFSGFATLWGLINIFIGFS